MIYELVNVCAGHILCRRVHILIVDTLTYIEIHLVTLIMSYESVDVHAGINICRPLFSQDLIPT